MIRTISTSLPKDEQANVLTHGLGVLMSIIGLTYLLLYGSTRSEPHEITGLAIFGGSMVAVYLASTIYHSLQRDPLKRIFRVVDHISIYFLIAGTHTPFLLYYMNNDMGNIFLAILWGLVLIGLIWKVFFFHKFKLLSVLFYMAMGWMALFTIPPMLDQMSFMTLNYIIAGGVSYSIGVIFFVKALMPYHHAVWHLFVMGGSFFHFMAVWSLV